MALVVPVAVRSDVTAVGAVAATSGLTMDAGFFYLFVSNTDCFIKQGTAPLDATAADASMFVPSRTPIILAGSSGAALSIIRDTADGKASLTPVILH